MVTVDNETRTQILGFVFCVVLLGLIIYGPLTSLPRPLPTDDDATITVTARLIRQSGYRGDELDDNTISHLLVQFGYNDCRNLRYQDEIEVCRKAISRQEIELVRKRLVRYGR